MQRLQAVTQVEPKTSLTQFLDKIFFPQRVYLERLSEDAEKA